MFYTDITGQFTIHLAAGWQNLNGQQAIQFARFRSDELGDLARIQRQQLLLDGLSKRLSNPVSIADVPKMIFGVQKYIDTNLSGEKIMTLVNFLTQVDLMDVKMVLLPGQFSHPKTYDSSYWIVDSQANQPIIQQYFDVVSGYAIGNDPSPHKIKLAIQNATANPQYSDRLEQYLKQQGFKIVYRIDTWPIAQQQTQIIAQKSKIEQAQYLKNLLQVGKIEASSIGDINSDINYDSGRSRSTSSIYE